jgi:hypothetical protein
VENEGQDTNDGRCIVQRKEKHDGLKVSSKARYCLRGFKEEVVPHRKFCTPWLLTRAGQLNRLL